MESQTAQAVLEALHQEGQAIRREALSILEALLYIGSGAQQGWPEEAQLNCQKSFLQRQGSGYCISGHAD